MKWITRKDIRVNRTATCWLVRRFIDAQAKFIFVGPAEVSSIQSNQGAIGFDAPNATYPHKNEKGLCSFAALVHERFSDNGVLMEWLGLFKRPISRTSLITIRPPVDYS